MTANKTSLDVLGRDVEAEAYRVRIGDRVIRVPEALMQGLRLDAHPSHQEAYDWIAAHATELRRALTALVQGRSPRAPMDLITLEHTVNSERGPFDAC